MIGAGLERFGLQESVAKGVVTPFLQWRDWHAIYYYTTGQSLQGAYTPQWRLLLTESPRLLAGQFGVLLALLGAVGAVGSARREPRVFALLAALFVPAAAYAITYAAGFAARRDRTPGGPPAAGDARIRAVGRAGCGTAFLFHHAPDWTPESSQCSSAAAHTVRFVDSASRRTAADSP
ncbi:MAG: hypothetical protein ACRDIB_20590 [Ardenticatenaceae bacterium]